MKEIEVYDDFYNIDTNKFFGIKEIVKVTRTTYFKNSDYSSSEISFYISSKKMPVKDVTFGEDASLIRTGHAPTNFSIIRNIAMNGLRRENYLNFPQAIRMLGGDVKKLCKLLV